MTNSDRNTSQRDQSQTQKKGPDSRQNSDPTSAKCLNWYDFSDEERKKFHTAWYKDWVPCLLNDPEGRNKPKDPKVQKGIPAVKYPDESALSTPMQAENTVKGSDSFVMVLPVETLVAAQIGRLQGASQRKIAVLNFADDKVPGGKYFQGKSTQEESLCARSSLLASIMPEGDSKKLYPLGDLDLLYSKNVKVVRDAVTEYKQILGEDKYYIDVITCAAPYRPALSSDKKQFKKNDTRKLYANKLRRVLRAACKHKVEVLVLGAWGCGIFGNPPEQVSKIMKEVLLDRSEDWESLGLNRVLIGIKDDTKDKSTWLAFVDTFIENQRVKVDYDGRNSLKLRWDKQ